MKFLFVFLFSFFVLSGLYAQTGFSDTPVKYDGHDYSFFPFKKGVFKKNINNVSNSFDLGYDKKQESLLKANLNKIISVLDNYPLLNPPQGLDVILEAHTGVNQFTPAGRARLSGTIELYFICYQEDENGKPSVGSGTSNMLTIYLNNPSFLAGKPVLDDIYACPVKCGEFHSYPIYETGGGEVTVLTNIKRPLFLPVSKEDFIKQTIAYYNKKIDESNAELKEEGSALTPKQAFNAGKKQRLKDYNIAYGKLMKMDPKQADEYKKAFEQMEKDLEEEINKSDDYSVSKKDLIDKGNSFIEKKIDELRSELNALSEEERKQQAYYSVSGLEITPSGLVSDGFEGADALVRVNPNLLDSKRPQSDIQLILLDWGALKPREYNDGKEAFNIEKWGLTELSKNDDFWKSTIKLLAK